MWPAQNFNGLQIEYRIPFEDRTFVWDIIIDQRHGLRRVQVEIGIADAANVETREGATEGALCNHRRHAGRKKADVCAASFQIVEFFVRDGGNRDWHILRVLLDALSRRDYRVKAAGIRVVCPLGEGGRMREADCDGGGG